MMRIEENLSSAFSHVPVQIRRWGIKNILTGSFAFLFGWKTDGTPTKIEATDTGALKVANVGMGLSTVESEAIFAVTALSSAVTFSAVQQRIEVMPVDYPIYISTSVDGVTFQEELYCYGNQRNTFDIACLAFKHRRAGINNVDAVVNGFR